jgi:hypothetical protein
LGSVSIEPPSERPKANMQWSDEEFRKRCKARARELRTNLTEVAREAGVAEEYFRKPPAHGRNIAGILKIAQVLKTDPAVLMGFRRTDHEMAAAVSLATAVYFRLCNYPPDDFNAHADEIIPEVIARTLKVVRKEFAAQDPEVPPGTLPKE